MSKSEAERLAEARQRREYGPLGETIDSILSHETGEKGYLMLSAIYWRIQQKQEARGSEALTHAERTFNLVREFDAEVNNGGFYQYFDNSTGNEAHQALQALKDISAPSFAALLDRAMSAFPDSGPPIDWSERQMLVEQIKPQAKPIWEECDKKFYALELLAGPLLEYTKKMRAQFLLS
jgi:hypothetical protein